MKLHQMSSTHALYLADFGHNFNYFLNQMWHFLILLPQTAIFGFAEEPNCQSFALFNHFLLLFNSMFIILGTI